MYTTYRWTEPAWSTVSKLIEYWPNVQAKLLEQGAKSNMVYSLDNRRLAAAKQAKVGVNTRWATPEEIQQEATLRRFSTNDAGKTICHN